MSNQNSQSKFYEVLYGCCWQPSVIIDTTDDEAMMISRYQLLLDIIVLDNPECDVEAMMVVTTPIVTVYLLLTTRCRHGYADIVVFLMQNN